MPEFEDFIQKAGEKLKNIIKQENDANDLAANSKANSIIFMTKNSKILRLLISHGIDITRKELNTQKTLLHHLVENKDTTSVEYFCDKAPQYAAILNAEANYPLRLGPGTTPKTALILAVEKNYSKILKCLVKHGADFQNQVGRWMPIDWATKLPTNKSYKYLMKKLADPNIKPITHPQHLNTTSRRKRLSKSVRHSSSSSEAEPILPPLVASTKGKDELPLNAQATAPTSRLKRQSSSGSF